MGQYGSKEVAGFIRREYGRLVEFVRRRLGEADGMEPEDIVQDVLAGLFDRADISAPIHNLAAYVYRSLRNRVVDAWRARRHNLSLETLGGGGIPAEFISDAEGMTSAQILQQRARWECFCRELKRLSVEEQAVIVATELDDWSYRELSAQWGVPVGTLLARKSRALKKLKVRIAAAAAGAQGEENDSQRKK